MRLPIESGTAVEDRRRALDGNAVGVSNEANVRLFRLMQRNDQTANFIQRGSPTGTATKS